MIFEKEIILKLQVESFSRVKTFSSFVNDKRTGGCGGRYDCISVGKAYGTLAVLRFQALSTAALGYPRAGGDSKRPNKSPQVTQPQWAEVGSEPRQNHTDLFLLLKCSFSSSHLRLLECLSGQKFLYWKNKPAMLDEEPEQIHLPSWGRKWVSASRLNVPPEPGNVIFISKLVQLTTRKWNVWARDGRQVLLYVREAVERQAPGGGSEQLPRPQGAALPPGTGQRLMIKGAGMYWSWCKQWKDRI